MPISGVGWELLIVRETEQRRTSDGKRRTVGTYQVFHDGTAQVGDLRGTMAETRGPGANAPKDNGRRIAPGRYPLWTQDGDRYVTWGYAQSGGPSATPKPGLELKGTSPREEILIHPGRGFLSSIGCLNPCTSLPDAEEPITYAGSRWRTIALIEDLKAFAGAGFPGVNGRRIPGAFVVVEGEPTVP